MMLRRTHIYFAENRPAIVAAMHYNAPGIYFEQDASAVLTDWRDHIVLATAVRASLERFSFRETNLRNQKETDWPSYIASGIPSVREFKRSYLCVAMCGLNEAELFYDASAQPHEENDPPLHVTINRHGSDDETERKLLKLFDSCSAWRSDTT
jgi:hypothetical protein